MSNENNFSNIRDVGEAESIIREYRLENPDDSDGAKGVLNNLLDVLFENELELFGSANEFHNFAVTISKILQDNQKATRIIRSGLRIHPMNADLLADAILYGYNCGEREDCREWYKTLQTIDKSRWTWRAFSFSKDFLMNEWTSNQENDYSIEDILQLVHDYQSYLPDEEDAWLCEFEVYKATNRKEAGIRVLEAAIRRFRFCPKCWLRYADIMMDMGEYEKAEPVIRKMCRNPKSSTSINSAYMNFLDGQCRMTKLYDSEVFETYEDGDADEETQNAVEKAVWNIYKAFRKAFMSSDLNDSLNGQIEEHLTQLEADTHIAFPDDWR